MAESSAKLKEKQVDPLKRAKVRAVTEKISAVQD